MTIRSLLKIISIIAIFTSSIVNAQPNWNAIKANATFIVPDTNYSAPSIQSVNVPGWEDGLYITRDGKHLFSTYLPLDAFSWITDLQANPICFNFDPYFRPPLLGIDTVTNPWGCPNYMNSDIVITERTDTALNFNAWHQSNLHTPMYFEGGACGVLKNSDTFDVFVYTKDLGDSLHMELKMMRNVPVNPSNNSEFTILSSTGQEDNPHIERLNATTLLVFFDRDRYIYYSLSYDNGSTWQTPVKITNVLNDQAPYDVQPHLWSDGTDWWVYFCADNINGKRCIYRSKQQIANDWNSWGARELVIEPDVITSGSGLIFGVGEPTLTQWGDLSFVVVYGNNTLSDTTDVFDCDPWILRRKNSPVNTSIAQSYQPSLLHIYPNPASDNIEVDIQPKSTIEILNIEGQLIKSLKLTDGKTDINISGFARGVYIIRARTDKGILVKNFVKE